MNENNYTQENLSENKEHFFEPTNSLSIEDNITSFLRETSKWGKFLAIIGFIFAALIALMGLGIMFGGAEILSKFPIVNQFFGGFIGFIYLLSALLYYFPSKYLYDFSVYVNQGLDLDDQESLSYSFSRLKSFFKFWGILMIIMLVIYAIIIMFIASIGIFATSLAA